MSSPLMQATDLRKIYANGLKEVEVLKGIDLLVEPGQMTAIVGACLLYTSDAADDRT